MKVCFFNVTATYLKGGLETYCWEAGRAMARRGHQVSIVCGNRGEARHDEVRLVQFPFRAEKEWPDLGVRFRRLAERLSFARHALPHLVSEGYDAVVVNKPFDFPLLWQARRKGLRARTLFRSGGTDFFFGDHCFAGAIDEWASASCYNARQVTQRYGREVAIIHNGVDTEVFRPLGREDARAARESGDDVLQLISVGRLVGWKGVDVVIEALVGLPEHLHFLVVGDGPERARLEAMVEARGLRGRVRFAGAAAHHELPALLSNSNLFVQPSKGEEAFGISVVEAMACGLPVLASANGGLPEIVQDGLTGRLLPPGDVAAWRAALAAIVAAPDMLGLWGRRGRERAESEFTWAANAARLEQKLKKEKD